MTVELIYGRDCPNAARARANLVKALAMVTTGEVRWTEWDRDAPESPPHVKAYGSPTILVDGKDVAGGAPGRTSPSCRLYRNATNGFDDAPSVEQIVATLRARDRTPVKAAGGRVGCSFTQQKEK